MSDLPWLKLWAATVDDEKLRLISPSDRWYYVALLCCKCSGIQDADDGQDILHRKLCVKLEVTQPELIEIRRRLIEVKLIDENFQPRSWAKRQHVNSKSIPEEFELDKNYLGYVYFIGPENGNIKIGYSRNPWARVKDFQTASHEQLHVVATVKTTENSEVDIHHLFNDEKIKGEWYRRSDRIIHVIKEIKNKHITTQQELIDYVKLLRSNYVSTTKDKDKEEDTEKDTDKKKPVSTKQLLSQYGIDGQLAEDFIQHRKTRKSAITATSLNGFKREADKAGITIQQAIEISIIRNWQGFNASWDWNNEAQAKQNNVVDHPSRSSMKVYG